MGELTMDRLFKAGIAQGASDIHLCVGQPPMIRVNGEFRALKTEDLGGDTISRLLAGVLSNRDQVTLDEVGMVDFSTYFTYQQGEEDEEARTLSVRGHALNELRGKAAVLRLLSQDVPSAETIGLSPELMNLLTRPQGLVLVTGPTGSGKSTTLASMMNYISTKLRRSISTIEQPVEYEIARGESGNASPVRQMDVPNHVKSFATALRGTLRQDPDVIMVGELRDYETTEVALHAAETGHLVFSTLHTNSAAETFGRMLDVFPGDKQEQARTMLASVVLGVVSQSLVRTVDGEGRVLCYELLLRHSSLPSLIRDKKFARIADLVQTQKGMGMQTFDGHLLQHVQEGRVDQKDAFLVARSPDAFAASLKGIRGQD